MGSNHLPAFCILHFAFCRLHIRIMKGSLPIALPIALTLAIVAASEPGFTFQDREAFRIAFLNTPVPEGGSNGPIGTEAGTEGVVSDCADADGTSCLECVGTPQSTVSTNQPYLPNTCPPPSASCTQLHPAAPKLHLQIETEL